MKLENIIKGLKNGTIIVNLMEHDIYTPITDKYWGKWESFNLERMLRNYTVKTSREEYKSEYDELVKKHAKGEISEESFNIMKESLETFLCPSFKCTMCGYTIRMHADVEIGQCLIIEPVLCNLPFFYCRSCGKYVYPYLYSETEIRMGDFNGNTDKCECEYLKGKEYLTATIEVTEHLGFANYFKKPYLNKPSDKFYDINTLKGRNDLMQDCAEAGIGYCQCDDCSCNVYLSKDGNKIIVAYKRTDELDKEYIYQGYICFDVWSYRCVDTAKIRRAFKNYDYLADMNPYEIGQSYFEVECNPGKYEIRHYDQGPNENIWTIIEKVN